MKKIIFILLLFLAGCQQDYTVPKEEIDRAVADYLEEHLDDVTADVDIDIQDLNQLMTTLIKNVDKSVIGVANFDALNQAIGTGSGVIYKYEDGYYYAITNNHVIEGGFTYKVYFSDETSTDAELVGTDPETDLAVLKFKTTTTLVKVSKFNTGELERGELVIAIGSPSGFTYFNSATMGVVSGTDRYVGIEDTDNDGIDDVFVKMLQHDAAINPGNSGGPLFNLSGDVIGINSLKLVSNTIEGMGFSIPVDITLRVIEDLEEYGEVNRARLGVYIGDVRYWEEAPDELLYGCYISDIVLGGPVDTSSDLQIGDTIVGFEGTVIDSLSKLKDILFQYHPGDVVDVEYYREGEYRTTTVTLGKS
ncbi:trypsin-like peptidase domain-containing protein [Mycoplasmatota bacterium WC44]